MPGRSTATVDPEDGDAALSAGTDFESAGDDGFDPSLFFSVGFEGGDAGAKSSSNPRSLSESESSRSSSEIGGNSEAKAFVASDVGSGPWVLAFLKLAKADSKSSLAFAWSIAPNGSDAFPAVGAADIFSTAGKNVVVPLLAGIPSPAGDAASFLEGSDPESGAGLGSVLVISTGVSSAAAWDSAAGVSGWLTLLRGGET